MCIINDELNIKHFQLIEHYIKIGISIYKKLELSKYANFKNFKITKFKN